MTEEEFLQKLAATKDKYSWRLNNSYIRAGDSSKGETVEEMYLCPLTAVCLSEEGTYHRVFNHSRAASELGLSDLDKAIADSADGGYAGCCYQPLREKMLKALGLKEVV